MAKREVGSGITRYEMPEGLKIDRPLNEEEFKEAERAWRAAATRPLWDRSQYVHAFELALADLTGGASSSVADFKAHEDWGWYYHNLIRLDRITRNRFERGEAALAALSACEFGQLLTELQIKLVWEQDALSGRKALEGARLGGEMRSRDTAKRAHLISAYQKRLPEKGESEAVRLAAKEAGYTTRGARRMLLGK